MRRNSCLVDLSTCSCFAENPALTSEIQRHLVEPGQALPGARLGSIAMIGTQDSGAEATKREVSGNAPETAEVSGEVVVSAMRSGGTAVHSPSSVFNRPSGRSAAAVIPGPIDGSAIEIRTRGTV